MTSRKNISEPDDWWDAFETAAKKDGLTLSEWMGLCCLENIPRPTARLLGKRRPRGKPPQKNLDRGSE